MVSLKIALLSYEYPPDTADGGIATYVYNAALMLAQRHHHVEVFAGSRTRTELNARENGVVVHRILAEDWRDFPERVAPVFRDRHDSLSFDVLETPECGAQGAPVLSLLPQIPLVVRLHTPAFIINDILHLKDMTVYGISPLKRA